jgi:WD40 repeat protein
VKYDANSNTAIGGLTDGNDYFVNVQSDGTVKLYDTKEHATAGGSTGLVDLTGTTGAGTEQKFDKYISVEGVDVPDLLNPLKFNPTGSVVELNLGQTTQLHTGDALKYDAKGGAALGGLTDGTTYYLIDVTGGNFQLAASAADARDGKAIALTGSGNTNQKLVDQTDSFIADATSGAGGGKIGVAGSVAVNVVIADTQAVIGHAPGGSGSASVTINGGNDVKLAAAATLSNSTRALPSDGGGSGSNVGVGASVAVSVPTNTVNA